MLAGWQTRPLSDRHGLSTAPPSPSTPVSAAARITARCRVSLPAAVARRRQWRLLDLLPCVISFRFRHQRVPGRYGQDVHSPSTFARRESFRCPETKPWITGGRLRWLALHCENGRIPCRTMKYLGNRWTDLRQIHGEDVFGPSLGRVWRSRSISAAYVRFMIGKTSLL